MWISLILLLPALAFSGPVEFGWQELRAAVAGRNPAPQRFPRDAEVLSDAPAECFLLTPDYVSGGDVRGVMYGLLEAARQIRTNGYVEDTTAAPVSTVRSLRYAVRDLDQGREFWKTMFQNLARARINRLHLLFGKEGTWNPPYPFLIKLVVFPDVELEGITSIERGRNLDALKHISQLANEYAVDLEIGIWSHDGISKLQGVNKDLHIPYLRAALEGLLSAVPAIRTVFVNADSGFLKDAVVPAIQNAGRLVTLETTSREMTNSGVPMRLLEPMKDGEAHPPLESISVQPFGVIRLYEGSSVINPAFVRLVARAVPIGAKGIEIDSACGEPCYSQWGRTAYDPEFPNAAAEARYAQTQSLERGRDETVLGYVQRLNSIATKIERGAEEEEKLKQGTVARFRARRTWADFLLENYERTQHDSALFAARNEYRGTIRVAETLKLPVDDLKTTFDRLEKAIAELSPARAITPMSWPAPVERPRVYEIAPEFATVHKPLSLTMNPLPRRGIVKLRLMYRLLNQPGPFHAAESNLRDARFVVPAADLPQTGKLIYYFEVERDDRVWRDPDVDESPGYLMEIREEPEPTEPVSLRRR